MDAEMRGRANGEAGGAVEGGCLIGDQRTDGKKFRRLRGGGGGSQWLDVSLNRYSGCTWRRKKIIAFMRRPESDGEMRRVSGDASMRSTRVVVDGSDVGLRPRRLDGSGAEGGRGGGRCLLDRGGRDGSGNFGSSHNNERRASVACKYSRQF